MSRGIGVHVRTCVICGRTLRLPNFARRSHFVVTDEQRGLGHYASTDVHVLSHLTEEERASWWTLPIERIDPLSKTNTKERW